MTAAAVAERAAVLMYHRVDADARLDRALCVTPPQFEAQLDWLAGAGYRPCRMQDFIDWHAGRTALPAGSVLLTFDDGYAGLHAHALPRLAARGWPATVFLVADLVGHDDRWNARGGAAGPHPLLDAGRIREMAAAGIDFHCHSATHADLTSLDECRLDDEVAGARARLQDLLGTPVNAFAYPFGRFDARVAAAVAAAGFELGFSVVPGFNRPGGSRFDLRRLDITGFDSTGGFARKIASGSNDGSLAGRMRYLARRAGARLGLST